jgi:hypothetical protein
MGIEKGTKNRDIAAASQHSAHPKPLTFKEFVRRQEKSKRQDTVTVKVPLIELMDFLMAGALLFIFISMLLLFAY